MKIVVDPTLRESYVWVYTAIHQAITEHGIAPSKGEIARAVGCSATTVVNAVRELKKRNLITETKFETRSIRLVDPEVMVRREPLPPWEEDLNIPKLWETPTEDA